MSTFQQRLKQFKQAVRAEVVANGERTHFSDAVGVSNSLKIVNRGLFVFNANFNNYDTAKEQVVVHGLVRLPPEDELYFAVVIRSDAAHFSEALASMRSAGAGTASTGGDDDLDTEAEAEAQPTSALAYTNNNKNVKGYLSNGRLYLRNKGFWNDSLPDDLSGIHSVAVDAVYFAVWPAAASARRSLLSREFVGYLGDMVGIDRLHELRPWKDESVGPLMRRMPGTIALSELTAAITAAGGHYPKGEIDRIHASLNFHPDKHFAILAGMSGTGKTQLAILYANAVHGVTDPSKVNPFQVICPVRPDWNDPTELTGYVDVLTGRYSVPPFLEAVLLATAHPDSPVFVLLDEMNLAPVEHYLADVLSALETGKPLRLHPHSAPLEGTNGMLVDRAVPVPPNLFIIGTINVDETTHSLSDKVLDRTMLIDMSSVDISGYIATLKKDPELQSSCDAIGPLLIEVHGLLDNHGLGFGYRLAKEVIRYHAFSVIAGSDLKTVTDDLMAQKVLAKLRGGVREKPLLEGLKKSLQGMFRTQSLLNRQIVDLNEFGSFRASR